MRQNKIARFALRALAAIAVLHVAFMLFTSVLLFRYRTANPRTTGIMIYRKIAYKWPSNEMRFLPLGKIPKKVRQMVIRVEDGTFYSHHGIIPSALKHAWLVNKQLEKPVYGGSTITMQTARTLFLVPEKSYLRKYLEMIIALEMELILDKDRILELYLNYAEWGKGVYGIEAASRHHYRRGIASLSSDQAVRLVTLLSSPIKYEPYSLNKSAILRSRYHYLSSRFP